MQALGTALDARFRFEVGRAGSPRTARTDSERLQTGPRWVWAHPSKLGPCFGAHACAHHGALTAPHRWVWAHPSKLGPCQTATVAEFRHAAARLPCELHALSVLESMMSSVISASGRAAEEDVSMMSSVISASGRAAEEDERDVPVAQLAARRVDAMGDAMSVSIDVTQFAARWVDAMGDAMSVEAGRVLPSTRPPPPKLGNGSVKEWRAHAKRLATPSRRSPTKVALVATVLGYQCAEQRAEAEGFDWELRKVKEDVLYH